MNVFIEQVAHHFNLGAPNTITVSPMHGSANRLWQFTTPQAKFVVKELCYDPPDYHQRRHKAAAFEHHVFQNGNVLMPEPIPAINGDFICKLQGSRNQPVPIRVHRFMNPDGHTPSNRTYLIKAGESLHTIQTLGQSDTSTATHTLLQHEEDPLITLDRMCHAPKLSTLYPEAQSVLTDALQIIHQGDNTKGAWIFTHRDHKPENSLCVHNQPAIIDWDECDYCHPKLEAVTAALRWSGAPNPKQDAFVAFLDGYTTSGGPLTSLEPHDFAKWVSSLVSWFCFQTRRALGDWPDENPTERDKAIVMAHNALTSMRPTLNQLTTWAKWY